ncbi:ABC transporter permease, partial [Burkholderia contaminans]
MRNDAALCFIGPVYDCAFAHAFASYSMSTTSLLVQS